MTRGVIYVVWGDTIEPLLKRSQESVRRFYPDMPMHVVRGQVDPVRGLQQKTSMISHTPFESTLFLDADTVVVGNLDYAFEKSEEIGLACCICECPWTAATARIRATTSNTTPAFYFFRPKAAPFSKLGNRSLRRVPRAAAGPPATGKSAAWNMTTRPASRGLCSNAISIRMCCR